MGNYAAFGFGRPRFGNWAVHGLGLTTFVPPAPEPTYPPLRTFLVIGDEAIPVIRDPACADVGRPDAILVPREASSAAVRDGSIKVRRQEAAGVGRDDAIRVYRTRTVSIKKDDC